MQILRYTGLVLAVAVVVTALGRDYVDVSETTPGSKSAIEAPTTHDAVEGVVLRFFDEGACTHCYR